VGDYRSSRIGWTQFANKEKGLAVALMWHDEGDFGVDEKYIP